MDIIKLSVQQKRIIVTKDSDFFKYHIIHGIPQRLLIVATGNIINKNLLSLFEANFPVMESSWRKDIKLLS